MVTDASTLFQALQPWMYPLALREVLLGAIGCKVSRTCLSDEETSRLIGLSKEFGFAVLCSPHKLVHRKDVGKGGWSNAAQRSLPRHSSEGDSQLYIASEDSVASRAQEADSKHDDLALGELLGIPPCCRETYIDRAAIAQSKQNDFVPLVAAATKWPPPFDPMTNYVAQYFGYSLLSHFPCSFRCVASAQLAEKIYETLAGINVAFADVLRRAQYANFLYTEYSGIIQFPNTHTLIENGAALLSYDPSTVRATAESPVLEAIRSADRLVANAVNEIEVRRESITLGRLCGDDFALCLFQ